MKLIFLTFFSSVLLINCTKDKTIPIVINECDTTPKKFTADVKPIFENNCVSCHNSTNNFANGQSWETYSEINSNLESILTSIRHEPGKTPMPFQSPKLNDSLIQVIECWVADGAQNN